MSADPTRYVFDSFALLAYLADEPGQPAVTEILRAAEAKQAEIYLTTVNYGEIASIVERRRGVQSARMTIATLDQLPITLVDTDRTLALEAAHVKASVALSYADAFAVALAKELQAILLTSDPEFHTVEHLITLQWLPQRDADS